MSIFDLVVEWLSLPTTWAGSESIPTRIGEHFLYSGLALAIAAIIAIPLGLYLGHYRTGGVIVLATANSIRALPTLGLLTLVVILAGVGLVPPLIALVILAIPPMLVNAYEGIQAVDPVVADAAKGVGMKGREVLWGVELPVAIPIILLGVRLAAIQVISAATIAAYVGLGGLGRYIFDGMGRREFGQVAGGSLIIALCAIGVEVLFLVLTWILTSPGVRQRRRLPLALTNIATRK